jgi:hypothetical protein
MTRDDVINEYVERLQHSNNLESVFTDISKEIDKLTYDDEKGTPISLDDKIKILEGIRSQLTELRVFSERTTVQKSRNDDFLDLVDTVIQNMKKRK